MKRVFAPFGGVTVRLGFAIVAWAAFCAWCVHGFPPCVDMPAHGAQMQTLAEVLRGDAAVSAYYRASFPVGYGATAWLFLPVTFLFGGAFSVRFVVWLCLVLMPVGVGVLARSFGRSWWPAVVGAPFAFSVSYWFGFVPTLFALCLTVFFWAGFGRRARWMWALGVIVMLCHVAVFGALAVGTVALALPARRWRDCVIALAPAFVFSSVRVLEFAGRTVQSGSHLPSEYDFGAHFVWLMVVQGTEGRVGVWIDLVIVAVLAGFWFVRRRAERREPVFLFFAMVALYFVTPKSVGGAWLVHVRFAVLAAVAALMLVEIGALPRWVRAGVVLLGVASLVISVRRHVAFEQAVRGIGEVTAAAPPAGVHAGVLLSGRTLPGSRVRLLDHLPQWWTARHGGVGTDFFADADHQPVRYVPGRQLPTWVGVPSVHELERVTGLLVYGDGALPAALAGFDVVAQAGRWRRLERRASAR